MAAVNDLSGTGPNRPMVRALAKMWWLILLRGIVSILFGALAFMWPGLTLVTLVLLYGAFALVDGGLRIALNRAYSVVDQRPWWLLRLESIGYVLIGAVALLALSFLVVLAPLIWRTALKYAPWIDPFSDIITFLRFGIASVLLIVALIIVHLWLPAGRRGLLQIAPGVLATLVMWLVAGSVFGRYLADFAFTYARYYAGLASVMIVLVFLYTTAAIFIYGGELNAAAADAKAAPGAKTPDA